MDVLFYAICLMAGVGFAIRGALAGHFLARHDSGLDSRGHAEAGFDHAELPGISPFSPTFMACFAAAFGAMGLILSRISATTHPWISVPLAAFSGFVIAAIISWIFETTFRKPRTSSEGHAPDLVGQTASVVTPIPQNGVGEIAYVQAGTRHAAPARSEKGLPIGPGQTVRITRIVGTQFFVDALQ